MSERAVCFDVMGTLFDLGRAGERLRAAGAPPGLLQTWFARTLHAAAVLTLLGEYEPFPELAERTLRSVLAQVDGDPDEAEAVVAALGELEPHPDAEPALRRLVAGGIQVLALTNGTRKNTERLLARSGLERHVAGVVATEDVRAYKPHAAVYRRAAEALELPPERVTLVAAHGWDVAGARAAGLGVVWVSRLERRWPLPPPEPAGAPDLTGAVERILQGGPAT